MGAGRRVVALFGGVCVLAVAAFVLLGDVRVKHWLYRGRRPNAIARGLGAWWALVGRLGLAPNLLVALEVRGRSSGRIRSLPLVPVTVDGAEYAVSMLGDDVGWVRDVRAADGAAVLVRGRRTEVRLVEVPAADRAPILKAYLRVAAGARGHIPVEPSAPLAEFAAVAADFPVFRVTPRA